jgi:hypothetical protein
MLQRERSDLAKAIELKAKIDSAKSDSKEQRQIFNEHFNSATTMMRVVASTFAKLAAVENAREKDLRQREMQVSDCGGAAAAAGVCVCTGEREHIRHQSHSQVSCHYERTDVVLGRCRS